MAKPASKPVKRRKKVRKEEIVPVRMTAEQKRTLGAAAARAGLGLSTWLLTLGLKAMRDAPAE